LPLCLSYISCTKCTESVNALAGVVSAEVVSAGVVSAGVVSVGVVSAGVVTAGVVSAGVVSAACILLMVPQEERAIQQASL